MTEMQGKNVTEGYFVSCTAPAEMSVRVSVSAVGNVDVGETGYGCHTFYITDVFRNIVIIPDIRLLLCLNIVSCAHINMQFVIFTS